MSEESPVFEALDDVPVAGNRCLEAGAGVGNATAALQSMDAADIVAITNEREHATGVRTRFEGDDPSVVLADLRSIPLERDSVTVLTAHALFNVVPPSAVPTILAEFTRVAEPGAWLVVDDYDPVPDASLRALFAMENATAELSSGEPALTFYPADHLRRLVVADGWELVRERTLLDPVPWTTELLDAHAELARETAATLPDALASAVASEVAKRRRALGDGVETGRMYSLLFRLPE